MSSLNALIENGDWEGAVDLVRRGRANVNEVCASGQTPLQEAAAENQLEFGEALIEAGAKVNATDEDDMTALHTAARKGHIKFVDLLLSAGASINLVNSDGLTALHFAAHRGHDKVAEMLLNKGASVTTPDHYDDLPIHFAASEGHVKCIKLLLNRGSPIAPQTNRGNTPLHLAAIKGKIDAVEVLLENGSPILANASGQTPLTVAESKNKTDCAIAIRQYEGMLEKKKKQEELARQREAEMRSAATGSRPPPHLQHAESEMGLDSNAFVAPGVGPIIPATIKPGMTSMDLSNMNQFVLTPPRPGLVLQGKVKREKQGKGEVYSYVLENKLSSLLLCAKKRSDSKTAHYALSTNRSTINSVERKDPEFVGKLRGNFSRSEYHLYDDGENPASASDSKYGESKVRCEQAVIFYSEKYPREITAIIPARASPDKDAVTWRPMIPADSMLSKFKNHNTDGMLVLKNKAPSWNNEIHGYVLDFYGRVTMKSSKNFQLIAGNDSSNTDQVLLLFGRTGKNDFTLDFQYPISPVQAFGIVLTAFDTY